jgi:hypothetical protein
VVEAGGDARQVPLGRKGPREDLVHDGVPDPVGDGASGLARPVPAVAGLAPDGVGDRTEEGDGQARGKKGSRSLHGVSDEGGVNPHSGCA